MISLTRVRSRPPIDSKFTGTKLIEMSLRLLEQQREIRRGNIEKHNFDSGIWKKAKAQLLQETADKCAYCETPTAVVTFGDVEHYRPKSKYWWLAYCLDNYLASCAICNQKFKQDKFTFRNSALPAPRVRKNSADSTLENMSKVIAPDPLDGDAVTDFESAHELERPLPINPYTDDPSDFFAWRADENIEEVELVANSNNPDAIDIVDAAKEIYGLDRPQLRTERYRTFAKYKLFRLSSEDAGISASLKEGLDEMIQTMAASRERYTGMILFFESLGNAQDWEQQGFLIPKS